VAALASLIAGFLTFVVAPLQDRFSGSLFDFHVYLDGARAAAHHADMYAVFLQQLQNPQLSGFDYPPVVAWLLEPLTWLPLRVSAIVWIWLMLACTAAGCVVLSRTVLPRSWPRLELAALATFVFAPATFNLRLGQMEPVVFLLLVGALVTWMRGRRLTCGVLIGLAASLKLAPLVLIVLLLRRRWWGAALATVATAAGTTIVGVLALGAGPIAEYITRVLPALARQDGWVYNQSLGGVVNRVADHAVLTIQPEVLLIAACSTALGIAVLAVAALLTRPGERSGPVRGMEFACGLLAMLLAGSITWYLHYVLLLIPLFVVAGYLAAGVARQPSRLGGTAFACLLITGIGGAFLADASFVNVLLSKQGSLLWWPFLQLTSLPALSVLALFAACAVSFRGPRRLALGARRSSAVTPH
jgi:alpha-1,2-mannosyltransferase